MCSETQYVAGFLLWLCPNTQWQWHTRTRTMYSSLPLFSPYSSSTSPVQLCRHGSGASPVKLNLVSYGISLYLYLLFATGFQITYCEIYWYKTETGWNMRHFVPLLNLVNIFKVRFEIKVWLNFPYIKTKLRKLTKCFPSEENVTDNFACRKGGGITIQPITWNIRFVKRIINITRHFYWNIWKKN